MAVLEMGKPLKAEDHAQSMANYIQTGTVQAYAIGNRGPIRMDANGKLEKDILDAYWEHGFYVFEDVVGTEELDELRAEVEWMLDRAPTDPKGATDAKGRQAFGQQFTRPCYRYARPLSDPLGGTS